jgi:excisionase family DNA binding protein
MNNLDAAVQNGLPPRLITISEAAQILNVKVSKLRQAIFRREITYVKLGNLIRFREKDLENFINSNVIIDGKRGGKFPNKTKVW